MKRLLSLILSLFFLVGFPLHAQEDTNKVVAEVSGRKITLGELNKALGNDLYEMNRRIYDLKKMKLEEMIGQTLLEKEALKKKITVQELLDKYVRKNVKDVNPKDVDRFYEQNKAQLPGTKEQLADRIKSYLSQERYREAYTHYLDQLKRNAQAKIFLEKPERFRVELSLTDAPRKGNSNAKVEVVEFSDFQCPFCSRLIPTIDQIYKKYQGKISLVFKAFPLSQHEKASLAHQASLCAHDQGKFWPYHDKLFQNQRNLERSDLEKYATELKLDITKFRQCLDSGEKFAKVQKELAEGEQAGVRSTPTLFINGLMVQGSVPQEQIEEIINEQLQKSKHN